MAKTQLISEIPFSKEDKNNPKSAITGAMGLLEEDEILTLPLKKRKLTVTVAGKTSTVIESSIDFSKSMRISKLI